VQFDTGFGIKVFWNVLLSNGFGTGASVGALNTSGQSTPLLGDWNGDGCSDIISTFGIFISNCAGGFTTVTPTGVGVADAALAVDWDGDGRTDLLYDHNNNWFVLRSNGETFDGPTSVMAAPTSTAWFPIDLNGDGLVDMAYVDGNNSNNISYVMHAGSNTPADLAISFSDGFNIAQTVSYVPLTQNNYTRCTGAPADCPLATFPEQDYQGPLYVVNQFTASDAVGSTYQNQFWYYGAKLNTQGRGLESFYARRISDSRIHDAQNNLYTYDYFGQAFPYTGMLLQRLVSTNGNVSLGTPSGNVSLWKQRPPRKRCLRRDRGAQKPVIFHSFRRLL
jgi:hypothetical protein